MCWELLLPAISSKPFFEQAADSSLDYYLGLHSFTERHRFFVYISVYTFGELVTPRSPESFYLLRFNERPVGSFFFSPPLSVISPLSFCDPLTPDQLSRRNWLHAGRRFAAAAAAGGGRCGRVVKSVVKRAAGSCS